MKHQRYITAIVIILALHLVFVNTEILIKLIKILTGRQSLSISQTFGTVVFALSYSLITVLILTVYPRIWMFTLSSLFDGFAVFLNYSNPQWFALAAAIYLGLYTSLIIIATGFIERMQMKNNHKTSLKQQLNNAIEKTIENLQQQKRSLQYALNSTKDQTKREQTQNKLKQIENKLNQLQTLNQYSDEMDF